MELQYILTERDPFRKAELIRDQKIYSTQRELARALGWKPSHVSHYLRILDIPELVRDGFYAKTLSLTHLFILSRIKKPADLVTAYETVLAGNLTVTQTETLVREVLYAIKPEGHRLTKEEIVLMCKAIGKRFPDDATTKIVQTRIKAKITIEVTGSVKRTTTALRKFILRDLS